MSSTIAGKGQTSKEGRRRERRKEEDREDETEVG